MGMLEGDERETPGSERKRVRNERARKREGNKTEVRERERNER